MTKLTYFVATSNFAKHGLDFADVTQFDFDTALLEINDCDDRDDYRECRETAIGWCGLRLCCLAFVRRGEDEIRAIRLRKTTKQEVRHYADCENDAGCCTRQGARSSRGP